MMTTSMQNFKVFTASLILLSIFRSVGTITSRHRHRRDTTNYVIDTLVVADDIVFKRWLDLEPTTNSPQQRQIDATVKLKTYLSLVIHQVNVRLLTLDKGAAWSIQMSIAKFVINTNPLSLATRVLDDQVISSLVLKTMRNWVNDNNYANEFDHVLLFTGETMDDPRIRGYAEVGKMCDNDGYSVSFVTETGGYQSTISYVVHEIGHSLGAVHDGTVDAIACRKSDRYIMAEDRDSLATSDNAKNPWSFSSCSIVSIGSFLSNNDISCLTISQPAEPEFADSQAILPGIQDDADRQCQMIVGNSSRLCLGGSFGTLDGVCGTMYCLDTDTSTKQQTRCQEHSAAEGSVCAEGKICLKGVCEQDNRANLISVNPKCPYGDTVILISGLQCPQLIPLQPFLCYDQNIQTLCCNSCETAKTESQGCVYGDHLAGCSKANCGTSARNQDGMLYDDQCCATCSTDSPCVDVVSIEDRSCTTHIGDYGRHRCYNASVSNACCNTCAKLKSGPAGCEFGDHRNDGTCDGWTSSRNNCSDASAKHECCQTCLSFVVDGGRSLFEFGILNYHSLKRLSLLLTISFIIKEFIVFV